MAGFSLLFVLLGTSVGLFGSFLFRIDGARQVAGVLVIAIGLVTTGIFGPVLDRFMRIGVRTDILPAARSARALALGALVAIGWTPCIGPVLGAILTMGASSQDAWVAPPSCWSPTRPAWRSRSWRPRSPCRACGPC